MAGLKTKINLDLKKQLKKNRYDLTFGVLKGSRKVKEYAAAHNFGEGRQPIRQFIPFDDEEFRPKTMREIRRIFRAEVSKAIRLGKSFKPIYKKVGNFLKKTVLNDISNGKSPVSGKKFEKYANPKKYPGKLKPARPVNLKLTGALHKSLDYKIKKK